MTRHPVSWHQRFDRVGRDRDFHYWQIVAKVGKSNSPKNLAKVDLWTSLLLRRFSTPLPRRVIDFG